MKHIDTIALQGSIDDMRIRIATEQCAMHKVQLAVARWRGTPPSPAQEQTTSDTPVPASQLRWHAEAQCHFMCWLEQGGFSQPLPQAQCDSLGATSTADSVSSDAALAKGVQAQPKQAAMLLPAHCNDCTA